jgi:lambda family phage portal protein
MSAFDRVIGLINPTTAVKRERSKLVLEILKESKAKQSSRNKLLSERMYDAAAFSSRTEGWFAPNTSANRELLFRLRTIRNRSRELERNFSYAGKAIRVIKNNTVGTGIRPVISGKDEKETKEIWRQWAETTQCDFNNKKTFYGLQRQAMAAIVRDGEVLIRKRRDPSRKIPICLEVCEADLLDESRQIFKLPNGGWQIQGVEFDAQGHIAKYWMFHRHPMDSGELMSEPVPADEIIHLFRQDRPHQARGIPWAYAAMVKMRDFDDFEDAALMQQKVAACYAAMIHKEGDPDGSSVDDEDRLERLEPGTIEYLKPGEEIQFATPPVAQGQDGYARRVLLAIAATFDITYEQLTGDLSNVNFSSGRMGWIEMGHAVQEWQDDIMIQQICTISFNWLKEGILIRGTMNKVEVDVTWTCPRREMIDPIKETNGLMTMIQAGIKSHPEVLRELGYDPDKVIDEISEWNKKLDLLKLIFVSDFRQSSKAKITGDVK